jgi:hypothetical protein
MEVKLDIAPDASSSRRLSSRKRVLATFEEEEEEEVGEQERGEEEEEVDGSTYDRSQGPIHEYDHQILPSPPSAEEAAEEGSDKATSWERFQREFCMKKYIESLERSNYQGV